MKEMKTNKTKGQTSKPVSELQTKTKKSKNKEGFAFSKQNYVLMAIGLVIIFIGYALMYGGGSENPEEFNPGIFSFRRLHLSVVVVMSGYLFEIYAIMKQPKKVDE